MLTNFRYLAKKFAGKADLFEAWLTEKKDFISKDDLGSSLHAVQSKIRRHEAFEAQVSTHQLKLKELKDITKEIVGLGNTENNTEQTRIKVRLLRESALSTSTDHSTVYIVLINFLRKLMTV